MSVFLQPCAFRVCSFLCKAKNSPNLSVIFAINMVSHKQNVRPLLCALARE